MMALIGIDTGGTFTDFIWQDEGGRLRVHKEPSTPANPGQAILNGLARLGLPDALAIVHGSTVATNALLQRRGAKAALITTRGFRDVLEIGRQNRPDLYALTPQKPPPLVPREHRLEADERIAATGETVRPLDEAALLPLLEALAADGVESVAVCLLFSFLQPAHERRIGQLVRQVGDEMAWRPHLTLSSDLLPEYREFERTAATVINAYVGPLMERYLSRLQPAVAPRRLSIMQSNGGIISASEAGLGAVRTVLSGPAGGVVGARHVAEAAGLSDVITFDMGGTSTDVALVPGRLPITGDGEIAGLPLRLPMIDIHTVGAGGGSLAYLDAGGALHVGPASAGADPGPACYHADYSRWRAALDSAFPPGRVTVTDANLVLGRLDPDHFLGGEMRLHVESARLAVGDLARQMGAGIPIEAAAAAVVRVANAAMERAIRRISVERGHDPRRFTLVAFGGGGPLHACELAEQLRIPRVLVPDVPGVLSALGMRVAAPTRDTSRTVLRPIDPDATTDAYLSEAFAPLEARLQAEMAAEGHDPTTLRFTRALAMRYVGQSHELDVPCPPGTTEVAARAAFDDTHAARFGYRRPEAPVEIVSLRLVAAAPASPFAPAVPEPDSPSEGVSPSDGVRSVWAGGANQPARVWVRDRLHPGQTFDGPCLLFQYDTTTLVPPGWTGVVVAHGHLLLTRHVPAT